MPKPLTADTITDDQIRAFGATIELYTPEHVLVIDALQPSEGLPRREARARIAAILNTRVEASTGVCVTCGDRIARDGTCEHVRALLNARGARASSPMCG